MLVKMMEFGYLRVETEWESKQLLNCEKKRIDKNQTTLYKFGHTQSKFAPKVTLGKLEKTHCAHLMLVRMMEFGYLRVETEWQSE